MARVTSARSAGRVATVAQSACVPRESRKAVGNPQERNSFLRASPTIGVNSISPHAAQALRHTGFRQLTTLEMRRTSSQAIETTIAFSMSRSPPRPEAGSDRGRCHGGLLPGTVPASCRRDM